MFESHNQYQASLDLWKLAKEKESYFAQMRREAEEELLEITKAYLKETGVNNFTGGLKITTGLDAKWDNEALMNAKEKFDNAGYFFPFEIVWKPLSDQIKLAQQLNKELYDECLAPALTLKRKKPGFAVKE